MRGEVPANGPAALALMPRLGRPSRRQAPLEDPLYAAAAAPDTGGATSPRDGAKFAAWCRSSGADRTELPVNPVLAAGHGRSARRRAAIAWHPAHSARGRRNLAPRLKYLEKAKTFLNQNDKRATYDVIWLWRELTVEHLGG